MGSGLTCIGLAWSMLSCIATVLIIGAVLSPEWIIGKVIVDNRHMPAYFGAYKRCNYPLLDKDARRIFLIEECGRYESFAAMPSLYWQLALVCAAGGASLSLLLVLLLLPSMCMRDIVTHGTAPIVGFFQIVAAVLICGAAALYPMGWDNKEVRDACGPRADRYSLGLCHVGRAFVSMCVGAAMLLFCGLLSLCGGRKPEKTRSSSTFGREGEVIRGYDQPMVSTKA